MSKRLKDGDTKRSVKEDLNDSGSNTPTPSFAQQTHKTKKPQNI